MEMELPKRRKHSTWILIVIFCHVITFCKASTNNSKINTLEPINITTISIFHFTLMFVALAFLFAIFFTYALIWKKQNIHGWTVAVYSLVFFLFLVFESVRYGTNMFNQEMDSTACSIIGIFIQYFYIGMFSWMAVLNFDLCSTISSATSPLRKNEKKLYSCYNLFGFGIPLIMIIISVILLFESPSSKQTGVMKEIESASNSSEFGAVTECDIETGGRFRASIVTTILFGVSILMSCFTLKFLLDYMRKAKTIHLASSSAVRRRQKLATLFTKVFILLVISWVFEIGGVLGLLFSDQTQQWYLVLFDAHNLIQSIGFFWIYICKTETLEQIANIYPVFAGLALWSERKRSTPASETTAEKVVNQVVTTSS